MTEAREGGGCEVMGEVLEEEERRLSGAKGTFLKQGDEKLDIDSIYGFIPSCCLFT